MSIAFSWLNFRYWSFLFGVYRYGVYRYGHEVTFCFGVFSVQVAWEPR